MACALVALSLPQGGQAQSLCNDGEVVDLEVCRAAALEAAAAYAAGQNPGVLHLEIAAAVQADPAVWPAPTTPAWGGISIPALEGAINEAELRPYHAAASLGLDIHAFPDPDRGIIDLVQEAQSLHADVMATNYPALLAWHLWNLHAFGDAADGAMIEEAATRLQALQRPDGGWACTSPAFVSPDCGAWAAIALAMHDRLDGLARQRALAHFEAGYDAATGGYSDQGSVGVNAMTTALIINVYRSAELPGEVRDETWAYLLALQDDGGGFRLREDAQPTMWTTRTVVSALAPHHPLPRTAPVDVLPAQVHVGEVHAHVEGPFADASWICGSEVWSGLEREAFLDTLAPAPCRVHATGDGVHGWVDYAPTVRNDPPTMALPESLTTNRVAGIHLDPTATDPEGFPVEVAWILGPISGTGPVDALPADPGNHVLEVTASDPHGGVTAASLNILVQNLGPAIEQVAVPSSAVPNEEFEVSAQANDPDGDSLSYAWSFSSDMHEKTIDVAWDIVSLPEGSYEVRVDVHDAYGAAASWSGDLIVSHDLPTAVAPELTTAEAGVEDRNVTVHVQASPPEAEVWARWQGGDRTGFLVLDDGRGRMQVPDDVVEIDTILVGARHDGLQVERSWGPFVLAAVQDPSVETEGAPIDEDSAQDDENAVESDGVAVDESSEDSDASSIIDQEAPLGSLVPLVSLVAALGMHAQRARRPGRTRRH